MKRAAMKYLTCLKKLKVRQSDIESYSEDSDTKHIVEEPNQDNEEESHQLITPEALVQVEVEVLGMDEPPAKKVKKKVAELKWKRTSKFGKPEKCTLEASVLLDVTENSNPLLMFEGATNLNELVTHICDQANLYATQNGREFEKTGESHKS